MDFTSFVKELGIDKMPEERQKEFFASAFRTLNMRVSLRLATELTDEQKRQLEEVITLGDEAALEDLEKVYPNFRKIYQEEIDGLKEDMQALL